MKAWLSLVVLLALAAVASAGVEAEIEHDASLIRTMLRRELAKENVQGYRVTAVKESPSGVVATLLLNDGSQGPYGDDVSTLLLEIRYKTKDIVNIRLTDKNTKRWEVPNFVADGLNDATYTGADRNYVVEYTSDKFGFAVKRKSSGEVLFDTTKFRLVYSEYYLELTTALQPNANIYGLGERVHSFRLKSDAATYTLWAKDQGTPVDKNLYASHPYYMELRPKTGSAHGVFLLNSNGLDVVFANNALTYKVIGGVLDFWFFMGPDPETVTKQYHSLIGKPFMPPAWALGFHQCRWGYTGVDETAQVVQRYRDHKIPLEVMWNDIDYMDRYRVFTFGPKNFEAGKMKALMDDLHSRKQRYMMIFDAGLAVPDATQSNDDYPSFDRANDMNVFVKRQDGKPMLGKVWPGYVYFPDFFHPNITEYWGSEIVRLQKVAPFDGMWLDMNEVSNFCNGECAPPHIRTPTWGQAYGPENPPYRLNTVTDPSGLDEKTLRMDAGMGGTINYNVHNMYGFMETIASNKAFTKGLKKRPMLISRSTFPSHGRYGGHWLGDNNSSYDDMAYSIAGMLSFQLYGVPLVGADVCGFGGNTTEDLCWRWMQVGAFSPFFRNHNTIGAAPQEVYVFSDGMVRSTIDTIRLRYSLLGLYYTAFYRAHVDGGSVLQPLFHTDPFDPTLALLDHQFIVANALMVSPVLYKDTVTVDAYFPAKNIWYDYYTGAVVGDVSKGQWVHLQAPREVVPVHIRGGSIVPTLDPEMTVTDTMATPYTLVVALDPRGAARGELFLDDGLTLDSIENNQFTLLEFACALEGNTHTVTVSAAAAGYSAANALKGLLVYGVQRAPTAAAVDGRAATYQYNASDKTLTIQSPAAPRIVAVRSVSWSY